MAAVEAKQLSADATMILVLDANDAPAYTDFRGAESVRDKMAARGLDGPWVGSGMARRPTVQRRHAATGVGVRDGRTASGMSVGHYLGAAGQQQAAAGGRLNPWRSTSTTDEDAPVGC